jgi:phosphate acetyltransferase
MTASAPNPTQCVYLVPTGVGVGLTTVSMGLVRALDRSGLKTRFFKPVAQLFRGDTGPERSTYVIRHTTELDPPTPIPYAEATQVVARGTMDDFMERVLELYQQVAKDADVVVVEGLINMDEFEHATLLNQAISRALDASIVIVGAPIRDQVDVLDLELRNTASDFGGLDTERVLGAIVNFVNAPRDKYGRLRPDVDLRAEGPHLSAEMLQQTCAVFRSGKFKLLACVEWQRNMALSRTVDIANHLHARIFNEGEIRQRRIQRVFLCARTVENITYVFQPNALLIIPIDRSDLFIAACMAAANGVPLAGVVFTSADGEPHPEVLKLCRNALATGLPVMSVSTDSYSTATHIPRMNTEVPVDDIERIETSMNHVASQISHEWIGSLTATRREIHLSPAAFRYRLVQLARGAKRRIVLPEGDEPRTLRAANICMNRHVATCVLLADPKKVREIAEQSGLVLNPGLEILDPAALRASYIDTLVDLRKHKGMDRAMAESLLEDNIMLGTLMLKMGHVDGLVSGAVHTTAQTVRPALQIIKTRPGTRFVSSLFFMLLPDSVCIYADCAINENPDAETLADIALQSADSAAAFGIEPRVAMISYSTGESGSGSDVEKVREATRIAREKRPDLLIDGPLQYDAASTLSVARTKAPKSPVAGRATVYIFPDLNTGNTTYKAVQRSAKVISIGPMLQGLNKPVNDLSRGALVDDIVYTIALTAIQSTQG